METESSNQPLYIDGPTEKNLEEVAEESVFCPKIWLSPYRFNPDNRQLSAVSPPPPGYEYAEHNWLGDQINLIDEQGLQFLAFSKPIITLGSKSDNQPLTYGQICALAGDFYGTSKPISDGTSDTDRYNRFISALNTIVDNPKDQPKDARNLINYLQKEVEAVQKAVRAGKDPSSVYKGGEVVSNLKLNLMTKGRTLPSYFSLAAINWDHFGDDARTAYTTGHKAAIECAVQGGRTKENLFKAYTMNAFADHYLQDLFSSGHLRNPRRLLHGYEGVADYCSKYMHDEDCALGLMVSDPSGNQWMAYGDRRLLDEANRVNLLKCQATIQASAQEIYTAWDKQIVLPVSGYAAWATVPTKDSALATSQPLAPLFLLGPTQKWKDLQRRVDLAKRDIWKYDTKWTAAGTCLDIKTSGLWKYPMKM